MVDLPWAGRRVIINMEGRKMALTKGEVVQVIGRLVENVGKKLDDAESPNELTRDEVYELVRGFIHDVLQEYED